MTPNMKNTKFLLVLALSAVLTSCSSLKEENELKAEALRDSARIHMNDMPIVNEIVEYPYNNPVLIYGSSFGEFFQILYKTGKFEDMLAFTSTRSIKEFGRDKVLNFYQTMDFAYNIKLKSMNIGETPVAVTTLNYTAGIMATRNMLRMEVVTENDTCKIILKDLKSLR